MRKKEENPVGRKVVQKRNGFGVSNNNCTAVAQYVDSKGGKDTDNANRPGTSNQNNGNYMGIGLLGGSNMNLNMRNRIK